MLNIPHTSDEAEGFEYIRDFLYPGDALDEQALAMFFTSFVGINKDHAYYYSSQSTAKQHQMQAMGVLLRLVDAATPQWGAAFGHWYALHRIEEPTYVSLWFSFLGESHRTAAKDTMLRMLDAAPSIDIRVALMMDGAEHYPHLPIQTFIGKSLRRVKAGAFAKALKPKKSQMPLVLRMAKAIADGSPEFTDLAEAIMMGVFVQHMGQEPAPGNPQVKYSASEAILMLMDQGIAPKAPMLVASAQGRFKATTLLPDMMQFVCWALDKDPSKNWLMRSPSEHEQEFAVQLMNTLLDEVIKQDAIESNCDKALLQAHRTGRFDENATNKMRTWFIRRAEKLNNDTDTLVYVLDHLALPSDVPTLWEHWIAAQKCSNLNGLVSRYVGQGLHDSNPNRYYQLLRQQVSTKDVIGVFYEQAKTIFDRAACDSKAYMYNSETEQQFQARKSTSFLESMEGFFRNVRPFIEEDIRQEESFKTLVAATSMAYLFHACQVGHAKYSPTNGVFVNLLAEPLPLIRAVYPEHTTALNVLRKEVIHNASSQGAPNSGSNYHGALYKVLGRALYGEAMLNQDVVQGLTQSMGVDPLMYFQSCSMQKEVHFDVSGDVFETGFF